MLRRALGHLTTGVTVVTAFSDDGPTGMAANSVTSVSLDPPLLLLCPAKTSTTWPAIRQAGRFCVNVMSEAHADITRRFSQKGADRFAGIRYFDRESGPALDGAVGWIECEIKQEHDAGDHTIVVAAIHAIEGHEDRAPLVFFRGRYGGFVSRAE